MSGYCEAIETVFALYPDIAVRRQADFGLKGRLRIDKVLMVCSKEKVGSAKSIRKNGGRRGEAEGLDYTWQGVLGMDIKLVKWNEDRKDDLIKICNEVNRRYLANRMPYPYRDEDADWWLDMVRKSEGVNGIFRAICVDGKTVGNISIEQKSDVNCKDAEIGYLLLTSEWSKGIMTAAAREICDIAFSELDIVRITGNVYGPNIASQRVLLKNGFVLEGIKRNAICKSEHIYDLHIYGKYKHS